MMTLVITDPNPSELKSEHSAHCGNFLQSSDYFCCHPLTSRPHASILWLRSENLIFFYFVRCADIDVPVISDVSFIGTDPNESTMSQPVKSIIKVTFMSYQNKSTITCVARPI